MQQPELPLAELSRVVREEQARQRCPSLSAAAFARGEVVWQEALGLARVAERVGATTDTQYRIGSITKTFTAAAVMQLRDGGELDLDDPLSEHLPDAHHGTPTLRRLLAHLSGLQREFPGYVWETLEFPDRARLIAGLADAEQVLAPGTRWHYSNLAFGLLGEVVARLSGLGYEDYVRERLLEPLGLGRTTFQREQPAADGYLVEPYTDRARAEPDVVKGALAAAGSLWSTTADLARWALVLAEGAEGVLSPETAAEMRRFQAMADLEQWRLGWGLGLMLMREGNRILIGHGGAMPGFLTGVAIEPRERAGAVVLVNSGAGVEVEEIVRRLAVIVADACPSGLEAWEPAESVPPELEPLLGRWWSEGAEAVMRVRAGRLEARLAVAPEDVPPTVFEAAGEDRYRGVSGPEEGELLEVVRDADGSVAKLYWATYPLTRSQPFGG